MIFWKPNETPEERRLREEFEAQASFTKRLYEAAKKGNSSTAGVGGGGGGGAAASGAGASSGPIAGAMIKAYDEAGNVVGSATTNKDGLTNLKGEYTKLVATGGIDQITGEANTMVLEARGGVTQCTPINTVVGLCFDILVAEIKAQNEKLETPVELPSIEMIYSQFLHPNNCEALFGTTVPTNVYNKTASNTKYYSEDTDVAKVLTVLNSIAGENIKYAAKHLKEIYNLATDSSKTEAEAMEAVYKGLAIKWWQNTGGEWKDQYVAYLGEENSNATYETRRAFTDPREIAEGYALSDFGTILSSITEGLEKPENYDYDGFAGKDKEGNPAPIGIAIDQAIKAKGADGLGQMFKSVKESGGHNHSAGRMVKEFKEEILKNNDDNKSIDGVQITSGTPVMFRSPKYVKSNVIGLKQSMKESFDSVKSKYYDKKDKFDAKYNVKHEGAILSDKIIWNRASEIDADLLGDSSSWAIIIPDVLALARSNNGDAFEFYNPYASTQWSENHDTVGVAWYKGTASHFFENQDEEKRITFYEKAIRQTISSHDNHLSVGSTFDSFCAKAAFDGMKEGDVMTLYSGYNDTFYQVAFTLSKGDAATEAIITSFAGNVYRTPLETEVVENLKLGISNSSHVGESERLKYREVWRKKSKSAKNLSKIDKYTDVRTKVDTDEDLWKSASDSTRSLPNSRNNPSSELLGGLLEYDKYEGKVESKGEPAVYTKERVTAFDLDTSHFSVNNSHKYIHNMYIMPPFSGVGAEHANDDVLNQGVSGAKILKGAIISCKGCDNDISKITPFKQHVIGGK